MFEVYILMVQVWSCVVIDQLLQVTTNHVQSQVQCFKTLATFITHCHQSSTLHGVSRVHDHSVLNEKLQQVGFLEFYNSPCSFLLWIGFENVYCCKLLFLFPLNVAPCLAMNEWCELACRCCTRLDRLTSARVMICSNLTVRVYWKRADLLL